MTTRPDPALVKTSLVILTGYPLCVEKNLANKLPISSLYDTFGSPLVTLNLTPKNASSHSI